MKLLDDFGSECLTRDILYSGACARRIKRYCLFRSETIQSFHETKSIGHVVNRTVVIVLVESVVVKIDCIPVVEHRVINTSKECIGEGEVKFFSAIHLGDGIRGCFRESPCDIVGPALIVSCNPWEESADILAWGRKNSR